MKLQINLNLTVDPKEFNTSAEGNVAQDLVWMLVEYLYDVEGVDVHAIKVKGEKETLNEFTN